MQFKFVVIFAIVGIAAANPQRGHYAGANRPILGSRYQNEGAQNQASQGQQQNQASQGQQQLQVQPAQQQNFQAQPAQVQQNFQAQPAQVQQSFPSAVVAPTGNRIDNGNRVNQNQNQQGGFGGGFQNTGFGFPHDGGFPHGGFPHGGFPHGGGHHDHSDFGPFSGGFGGFNNGHHF